MRTIVWFLIVLLLVLHQDNWFWTDGRLVFGFMPLGLFYHACISLAAGVVWFLATRHCWPLGVDDAGGVEPQRQDGARNGPA